MPPPLRHVLLVEDDPSIRRFVRMALEDLPIRLDEVASLAQARSLMSAHPLALLIVDLMLPDGHGLDLAALAVAGADAQRAPPQVIVFSAGVSAATRQAAAEFGVWAVLEKPVSLSQLLASVNGALGATTPALRPAQAVDPTGPDARTRALHRHFGGQATLFHAFLAGALAQFPHDIAAADAALARHDLATVRREAHNLKSVLGLIGHDDLSGQALRLEQALAHEAPDVAEVRVQWEALRAGLQQLG